MSAHDELDEFKRVYAYQEQVKDDPLIKAFLCRVDAAVAAMPGVEVCFVTWLQDPSEANKVYHDHSNQVVAALLQPIVSSTDEFALVDEEALPYYRVRFSDGAELMADDGEIFSHDPKFLELINAVSGAFACARELGFAGPWDLAAHGTADQKEQFLGAYNNQSPNDAFTHWDMNHNTPAQYRAKAPITQA